MNKRNLMAGIFMGVAIAASIPLGINRSLSRVREDVSGTFYYDQAGYSIYDGLEKRREAANNLITLAGRYKDKNPELDGLMDSLDYCVKASENAWSDDYTYIQEAGANAALDAPAQALAEALDSMELSEQDRKYPTQMIKQMKSEQDKINRSSYNEEARAFNAKVKSLAPMALVKPMADFSSATAAKDSAPVAAAEAAEKVVEDIPAPPEAPAAPGAPDIDDFEQRVDQWADDFSDGVESGVEGLVDGVLDGIFN